MLLVMDAIGCHLLMDTHTNWLQLQMSKDVLLNGKINVTIVNLFTTVVTCEKYNSYTNIKWLLVLCI